MSAKDQQTQGMNKKQRRKNARAGIQTTQLAAGEQEEVAQDQPAIPTENNDQKVPDVPSITNGTQELELSVQKPVENNVTILKPETKIESNGLATAAAVTKDFESTNGIGSEDSQSPSPCQTPLPTRRRNKRIPITTAIPMLPPVEQKHSPIVKPDSGKNGDATKVYANHFPTTIAPNLMLYQYDAIVEKPNFHQKQQWEEDMNRDHRRRFVQQLAENKAFNFIYWYDEGKYLYSITNLNQRQFPLINTLPPGNPDKSRFCILRLSGQWSTATIFDYLRSPNNSPNPSNAIRILETLLKQALQATTHCEGSLFYPNQSQTNKVLPDGLELRLGFFQALCLTQAGLTLNLQTTLTKFYPHMDIIDFLAKHLGKDIRKNGMTSNDYDKARLVLEGCKITTQQSNYTQIYRIRSFSDIPERQTFEFTKGTQVDDKPVQTKINYNLVQYYKNEKNIELKFTRFRCLQCFFLHERHDPKHLPMELCRILPWQECERESAYEQREKQNLSIPPPERRYGDIMSSLQSCNYRSPPRIPLCQTVQLSVDDTEMKLINARILPPPVINNNTAEINMGRINLRGRFMDPIQLKSVAFVYFGPPLPSPKNPPPPSPKNPSLPEQKKKLMEKFVEAFMKVAKMFRIGPIQTAKKDVVQILENDTDRDANINSIDRCFRTRKNEQCPLVVCIMDSPWNELRPNIKLNGTVTYGITTQCLLYSKLQDQMDRFDRNPRGSADRILDNMCENLLRKINFKMQGTNTRVDLPFKTKAVATPVAASAKSKKEDAWQFMGADVLHPVCRQDKPSIAAVVGSGDSVCSTSAVRVCKQWPKTGKCAIEAVVELQQMVRELLEYYQAGNDRLPNKIVFYRDGVDDGQFARILNFEIPQIKAAFRDVYHDEPLPLLTFVVVKKRHHTRFFMLDNKNQTVNVPPGLVVDTDIVHPGQFSFFLNSHKALQGTNRPALYHVLYDEIKFTADELQLLTYYLCFTDPRSSTSEAIPSLIHQADLAASNARDLFPERDTSTNDGYAMDALEDPSLTDIVVEHLRVHADMRDTPHFG